MTVGALPLGGAAEEPGPVAHDDGDHPQIQGEIAPVRLAEA